MFDLEDRERLFALEDFVIRKIEEGVQRKSCIFANIKCQPIINLTPRND